MSTGPQTMGYYERVVAAAGVIRTRVPEGPPIAVVLGSGLGEFADRLDPLLTLPYDALPDWPPARVVGHAGRLVIGRLHGRTLAVLAGRAHLYEGHGAAAVTFAVRVLGVLGVNTLVLTNAAGAVNAGLPAGSLMVIDDHINLTGQNPLVGANEERFGPRFPDMTALYTPRLRRLADEAGLALGRTLPHGIYAGLLGPSYETPAEIRYLRAIGADAVGMSTVLEAIAARHMGIEVLGLSCITNMAAGVLPTVLSHDEVLESARLVRDDFIALLESILERL